LPHGRGSAVIAIDIRERLIELPPHSFWVREAGSGPPVVLIHGLGGSSDWWRQNFEALARDHRVCAVDLVGFGKNRFFLKRSRLPLDFAEIASLLARWIEADLGEPAYVIGNSMGGHVALHLAAARPDVVRSLVLVNSTGIPFRVAPLEHIRNFFVPRGFWSFLIILARDVFRAGPTSIGVALGRVIRDDARPLMREIRVPVLLVWGESDPLVPLRYAKEMLHEIPNSQLEVIPRAGHVPMWENPRAFNDVVLRFLGTADDEDVDPVSSVFSWAIAGWTRGIAYRQAGRKPNIVLVHGLGMSSEYFIRFAEALFADQWRPVAPDLPGFGESADGAPGSPHDHALTLAAWADVVGIEDAVWVGHSLGCNVVEHLGAARPDLVASTVHIGPLWRKESAWRLFPALFVDAMREPASLFPYVIRAYWRAGFARWFRTFTRYAYDIVKPRPAGLMVVGQRDPLVDASVIADFVAVPGAHACHYSNARETASVISGPRLSKRRAS
jgi:pimeloyl-ACP methyl ester carboxylesterase